MTDARHEGYWWLPASPEQKVPGSLKLGRGEWVTLELLGVLGPNLQPKQDEVPLIHGFTERGKSVTLFQCTPGGISIRMPGFSTEHYTAQIAALGVHAPELESFMVTGLSAAFEHLAEWTGQSGLGHELELTAEKKLAKRTVVFIPPTPIKASAGGVQLSFNVLHEEEYKPRVRHVLGQRHVVTITASDPRPLLELIDGPMQELQTLIALGLSHPVHVTKLEVYPKAESRDAVKVVLSSSLKRPDARELTPREYCFLLPEVADSLEPLLTKWLARDPKLLPAYRLYLGVLYSRGEYLEHSFLSMAQALESYHRESRHGQYLPDEAWNNLHAKLEGVIDGADLPQGAGDSLRKKLEFMNEHSLRRRLKDMLAELSPLTDELAGDRSSFVDRIVALRNYLTHYSGETAHPELGDLYQTTARMRLLLEVLFMTDLGINRATIEAMIRRKMR
jgi:ApeA-like protein/HEPN superfamily Apea-like protein